MLDDCSGSTTMAEAYGCMKCEIRSMGMMVSVHKSLSSDLSLTRRDASGEQSNSRTCQEALEAAEQSRRSPASARYPGRRESAPVSRHASLEQSVGDCQSLLALSFHGRKTNVVFRVGGQSCKAPLRVLPLRRREIGR